MEKNYFFEIIDEKVSCDICKKNIIKNYSKNISQGAYLIKINLCKNCAIKRGFENAS